MRPSWWAWLLPQSLHSNDAPAPTACPQATAKTKHLGIPVESPSPLTAFIIIHELCIRYSKWRHQGSSAQAAGRLAHCLNFPTDQSTVASHESRPQPVTGGTDAPQSPAHMRPTSRRASSCLVLSLSLCAANAFRAICGRSHAVRCSPAAHCSGLGCQECMHASTCCWGAVACSLAAAEHSDTACKQCMPAANSTTWQLRKSGTGSYSV